MEDEQLHLLLESIDQLSEVVTESCRMQAKIAALLAALIELEKQKFQQQQPPENNSGIYYQSDN